MNDNRTTHNIGLPSMAILAALLIGVAEAQAVEACGPIDPGTGKPCVIPGPITSKSEGQSGTNYHWEFSNSCDHGVDIIFAGGQPTVPARGTYSADCNVPNDSPACPWKGYQCPASTGNLTAAPAKSPNSGVPPSKPQSPNTNLTSPSDRDQVEASLELSQARHVEDLGSIVRNYPNTNAAKEAKTTLQQECTPSAVEDACSLFKGKNWSGDFKYNMFNQCVSGRTEKCHQALQ
jgi:hypothetical protein